MAPPWRLAAAPPRTGHLGWWPVLAPPSDSRGGGPAVPASSTGAGLAGDEPQVKVERPQRSEDVRPNGDVSGPSLRTTRAFQPSVKTAGLACRAGTGDSFRSHGAPTPAVRPGSRYRPCQPLQPAPRLPPPLPGHRPALRRGNRLPRPSHTSGSLTTAHTAAGNHLDGALDHRVLHKDRGARRRRRTRMPPDTNHHRPLDNLTASDVLTYGERLPLWSAEEAPGWGQFRPPDNREVGPRQAARPVPNGAAEANWLLPAARLAS